VWVGLGIQLELEEGGQLVALLSREGGVGVEEGDAEPLAAGRPPRGY